ncbi:MAG: hypothetical protein HQL54_02490 [Magnetococcales bacterium]|nr:hypothetical protein [Magnetococcales bacterium]
MSKMLRIVNATVLLFVSVLMFGFVVQPTDVAAFDRLVSAKEEVNTPVLGKLLFFTNPYCGYCRKFETEVGNGYHNTDAAKQLPLIEVTMSDPGRYEDIAMTVYLTPTFIVTDADNNEHHRIQGYANSEMFWWKVDEILTGLNQGQSKHTVAHIK